MSASASRKRGSTKIKQSRQDVIFSVVNYTLLSLVLLIFLYPLIYIVSSSFSSGDAVIAGRVVLLPVEFSLDGYKAVFQSASVWRGYLNSFIYMLVGTLINVVVTVMAAYPLSRKDIAGRGVIMLGFTFTMIFSGGLVPTYMVVNDLRLTDTLWAMVVPGALSIYYMIIARTFFQTNIPVELQEAAEMSGCNDWQLITKIILPLSKPIIAVLVLFYAVGHWNSYFNALIYLKSNDKYPLQIVLREILIQNQNNASMMQDAAQMERSESLSALLKYSLIVVASVPVLCIYPFVQKYFVKGMMIGSVKG